MQMHKTKEKQYFITLLNELIRYTIHFWSDWSTRWSSL